MAEVAKCIGLLGWIKGHKFIFRWPGSYPDGSDFCVRCGMPKGGWK